jgi:hypothetical protein
MLHQLYQCPSSRLKSLVTQRLKLHIEKCAPATTGGGFCHISARLWLVP